MTSAGFVGGGGGSETRNGVVNTQPPRISSSAPAGPGKSDVGKTSGIPSDISDHVAEADTGEAVWPSADMTSEKKRGIFSMLRRKKDNNKETKPTETKPTAVVILLPHFADDTSFDKYNG